ncbi:unnamed protein product [Moneuplotes crassus]|uniref:Uncharacterized protein n=1 Tax=Euplotes crassus TaxID=5936 RepID=A0AAD1Y279_EUPCR|nr:unnamed protein product [Moneuplotes crassus]
MPAFFQNRSLLRECSLTCKTCDDDSKCLTCRDGYQYDPITHLCEAPQCGPNEFYSGSTLSCVDCGNSCSEQCAYRNECFACPDGQYFDLNSYLCVDQCDLLKIQINHSTLGSVSICRSREFYINPLSQSTTELGTIKNPYKELNSAFQELFYFHSHSDNKIVINLYEDTTNFIKEETYLRNITEIIIKSYSDTDYEPRKAKIVGIEKQSNKYQSFSPSKLILLDLQNIDFKIEIQEDIEIPVEDKQLLLQSEDSILLIYKTNLIIQNIHLSTEYGYISALKIFLNPIKCEQNLISISASTVIHEGGFMSTSQQMSLEIINSEFDLYKSKYGLNLNLSCSQPEEIVPVLTNVTNTRFYFSQDPPPEVQSKREFFIQYGGHDLSFTNTTFMHYGINSSSGYNFVLKSDQTCNYTSIKPRAINITDVKILLNSSWNFPPEEMYFGLLISESSRTRQISTYLLRNIEISNVQIMKISPLRIETNEESECQIYNITFTNLTTAVEIMHISGCKELKMHQSTFKNITSMINGLLSLDVINNATISSTVLKEVHLKVPLKSQLMSFTNSKTGRLEITNFTYSNGSLGEMQTLLSLENLIGDTVITNFQARNIISSSSSYIKIKSSKSILLDSLGFADCSSISTTGRYTNSILIDLSEIYSELTTNITIRKVDVINSTVNTLWISNKEQSKPNTLYITVSDLHITNTIFTSLPMLISTGNQFSGDILHVKFNRLIFENISSPEEAELVTFGHQTQQFVEIHNSVFRNISQMGMVIEGKNKTTKMQTKVLLNNITAEGCHCNYCSFLTSRSPSEVHVLSSSFTRISSISKGSVFSIYQSEAAFVINNSLFYQNQAINGAIFFTDSNAFVNCTECNFTDNFAITNSIASFGVGTYINFHNCTLQNNQAFSTPVLELSLSPEESIISNCTIKNNTILPKSYITSTLSTHTYINPLFTHHIASTPSIFPSSIYPSALTTNLCSLSITTNTLFLHQPSILHSSFSSVTFSQTLISSTTTPYNLITTVHSNISVTDLTITGVHGEGDKYVLTAEESTVRVDRIEVDKGSVGVLDSADCQVILDGVVVNQETQREYVVKVVKGNKVVIRGAWFGGGFGVKSVVYLYKSTVEEVGDVKILNVEGVGIYAVQSVVESFSNITLKNVTMGAYLQDSQIKLFANSTFENCGTDNVKYGGAIYIHKKNEISAKNNEMISNCNFTNNKAQNGAAIAINNQSNSQNVILISDTSFDSNTATVQGGGIYYTDRRPLMKGLRLSKNNAVYGSDIASHSYMIRFINFGENITTLDSVGSGVIIKEVYQAKLVDYDGQTMNLINKGVIKIERNLSHTSTGGIPYARITNGVANLTDFSFIALPGSLNIPFSLTSNHINYEDSNQLSQLKNTSEESKFIVNFRYCKPGEIQTDNKTCTQCNFGSYSLEWNSTRCQPCIQNANCLGADKIEAHKGYWRSKNRSENVISCLREKSCLGGYHPDGEHPVACEKGYEGFLCAECSIVDGNKYQPSYNYECLKCPSKIVNLLEIISFQLIALAFISFIIIINYKKKGENQLSVLLRIFINYMQLMTIIMTSNINFPSVFHKVFTQSDRVNSPQRTFFSFDCLIENYEIRMFAPSNALLKLSLYLILPIVVLIFVVLGILSYRLLMRYCKSKKKFNWKRCIAISFICIVFIFHPTLISQFLSTLQCVKVDSDDFRMLMHMEFKCYSSDHLKWIFLVGFPILLIWVIGMPAIAFFILLRKKRLLEFPEEQKNLLVLYQGLRSRKFYWELINTFRKFIVISLNIFMEEYNPYYRILCIILSLTIIARMQERLRPYKIDSNNKIEMLCVITIILTLYCTLVFIPKNEGVNSVYYISLILAYTININFIVQWAYLVLCYLNDTKTLDNRYFRKFMIIYAFVLCKKTKQFSEQIPDKKLLKISPTKNRKRIKKRKKRLRQKVNKKQKPRFMIRRDSSFRSPAQLINNFEGEKAEPVSWQINPDTKQLSRRSVVVINPSMTQFAKSDERLIEPRSIFPREERKKQ